MKALTSLCTGVCLAALVLIGPGTAEAQQPPGIIEIIACNFVDGSDAGDLEAPMNALNEWMDEHGLDNFAISTVLPIFTSEAFTYDVLFFNRWINASAMGQGLAAFYGPDGGDAVEGFEDVVECSSTTAFAGILLQPPGESRNGGPMQFFNCTVKENRTVGDGIAAINAWAEATRASGAESRTGHAVLLPIAGENPEATYNFKWLVLFESFQGYGDGLGRLFGQGAPALGDIIGPVMDCDSARVYNQIINRRAQTN